MPGFEDLFRTEYARLVRCLRAVDGDADECVQQAFARAYARWRWVRDLGDPCGWVRREAVARTRARRSPELLALALYYGGGYDVSEIAHAMSSSEGRVFGLLRQGREHMRAHLPELSHV
jgi:RNA polymerase sigma-70 factor (ECF subfamily)